MKKILFLIILTFLIIVIPGCKNEEYKLIELSGTEFVNNFFAEDIEDEDINVVFAVYSNRNENTEQFLEDLDKVARLTKEYIFCVDFDHTSVFDELFFEDYYQGNNIYVVIQNGKTIVSEEYTDYTTMFKKLNGKKYDYDIKYNSQEYIDEQIKIAQEEYDKGRISTSLSSLYSIWNSKEAKEFYETHAYYKLIHHWEGSIPTKDSELYHMFAFNVGSFFNTVTIIDKLDKAVGFEKPEDGDLYFYYIKDGYFYLSETEDGEYKKSYKINKYNDQNLFLEIKKDLEIGMFITY